MDEQLLSIVLATYIFYLENYHVTFDCFHVIGAATSFNMV